MDSSVAQQAAAGSAADERPVALRSSDDRMFTVPRAVAKVSVTLAHLLQDLGDDDDDSPIPVPNVTGDILEKVVQYCEHHMNDAPLTEEQELEKRAADIVGWDAEFTEVNMCTLFHMILAANFLDVKGMLDLTCKRVAHTIRGKSDDEIREIFGIAEPFTEEEKAAVIREHPWCADEYIGASAEASPPPPPPANVADAHAAEAAGAESDDSSAAPVDENEPDDDDDDEVEDEDDDDEE